MRRTCAATGLEHSLRDATPDNTAYACLHMTVEEVLAQLPSPDKQMVELRIEGHEVADIAGRTK